MAVGHLLYTDYLVQFLLSGNILLLSTIGPVVLVLTKSSKMSKFQVTFIIINLKSLISRVVLNRCVQILIIFTGIINVFLFQLDLLN